MNFELFISVVISIFVMVDSFGNIPVILSLTTGMSGTERRYIITRASIAATIILIVFAVVGQPFMDLLYISLDSLRIAGGMLLIIIALQMLTGSEITSKKTGTGSDAEDGESIAITPIATPLMVGPGTMALGILYMNEAPAMIDKGLVIVAILIAMLLTWIVEVNSDLLFSILHKDGTKVLTKIMGIVLAAIAVEMIVVGLTGAFPVLA